MFELVIGILFPLFALVFAGFCIAQWMKVDLSPISRINMDIFLPALVFASLSTMPLDMTKIPLLSAALLAILVPGLLMFPVCKFFQLNYKAWAPPYMFRNSGNFAIPLFTYTFGEKALASAVLLFVVSTCAHVSLGLAILSKENPLKQVIRMPIFLVSAFALLLNLSGVGVWKPLHQATELLGQVSVPIMLLSLGGQMRHMRLSGLKIGLICTFLSLATGGITFLLIDAFIPLTTIHLQMMLLFSMLPPAVMNFLFAERLNIEPFKVASMVLFGNFMCLFTLPILLSIALSFH